MQVTLKPADSDEPISEEWLRSVGFDGPRFDADRLTLWNLWMAFGPGPVRIYERIVENVKSRGSLRRLCTELDIPLKPAKETR